MPDNLNDRRSTLHLAGLDAIDELVTLKRLGYQGFKKIIRQTDFSPLSAQEPSLKHRVRKILNGYPALLNTARQLAGVRRQLLPSPAGTPQTQAREHAGSIFSQLAAQAPRRRNRRTLAELR